MKSSNLLLAFLEFTLSSAQNATSTEADVVVHLGDLSGSGAIYLTPFSPTNEPTESATVPCSDELTPMASVITTSTPCTESTILSLGHGYTSAPSAPLLPSSSKISNGTPSAYPNNASSGSLSRPTSTSIFISGGELSRDMWSIYSGIWLVGVLCLV